jgi:hypothetical protein
LKSTLQTDLPTNPVIAPTTLFLQVSEQGIRLPGEKVNYWKNATQSLIKQLEAFQIDKSSVQVVEIEIVHPAFLLVPNAYNDPLYRMAFLEKALGENCMDGVEMHEQSCSLVESTMLFLVSSSWKDQLSAIFPLAKINYQHILGNEIQKAKLYIHPRIHIFLQESHAYITYFQHGKLQLINVFPYEHELALAFYLHSIRDAFNIQWNQESIRIQGPDAQNQELIENLIRLNIPLA